MKTEDFALIVSIVALLISFGTIALGVMTYLRGGARCQATLEFANRTSTFGGVFIPQVRMLDVRVRVRGLAAVSIDAIHFQVDWQNYLIRGAQMEGDPIPRRVPGFSSEAWQTPLVGVLGTAASVSQQQATKVRAEILLGTGRVVRSEWVPLDFTLLDPQVAVTNS